MRVKGEIDVQRIQRIRHGGNVLDLAIGVIIGVAFGGVVTSLVNDIIMPPIGMPMGGFDFKDHFIALKRPT